MKKTTKEVKTINELKDLKSILKSSNGVIYATVTSVSSSGMSRNIKINTIDKKSGYVIYLTYKIANILGYSFRDYDGSMHVNGCGMDMIFKVLYDLNSLAIYKGVIRASKNRSDHDLHYHGLIDTNYRSF